MIPHREDEPSTAPTIDAPSWLRPGAPREPGDAGQVSATPPDGVAGGTAERPTQPGKPPDATIDVAGDTVTDAAGDAAHRATPEGPARAARAAGAAAAVNTPGTPGTPLRRIAQFVLLECIGAGGMGAVFAAFDDKLERKVAIKLVATRGSDERARQRLLREAQALARLSHPNVVTVYEVGTLPDGGLFIAMELVKGQTLRAWQRRSGRTWREIVATYAEAGRGLAAAHQSGIVHRDFKPDNVLVGDDGRVRVADFGLAFAAHGAAAGPADDARAAPGPEVPGNPRPAQALTAPGRFAGTPGYMAPEQLAGAAIDARADQYSFCAALHEALHGELPDAAGGDRPAHGPRRGEPEPAYPRWLRDVVQRGLAHDPGERFATMELLLAELLRSRERNRRRILAAAALAGGLIAAGAMSAVLRSDDPPPCPLATAELAGVWDAPVRQHSEAAILGTAAPFAPSTWGSTRAALDRYAERWLRGQQAACEATHVRHVQSAALLDHRMECLAARRRLLSAVTEVLQRRPGQAVAHAGELLDSLGDVEVCADTSVMLELSSRAAAPPANAAVRARAAAVRQQLASATALLATGDVTAAEPVVAEAERAARDLDDDQVRAEIRYVAAHVKARRGEVAEATVLANQAVALAVASHHDELPADVWLMLARNAGSLDQSSTELATWLSHAEAWFYRLSHSSDSRRIEIEHVHGKLQMTEEQPRAALATLSHAIEAAEALWGKDDPRLISLLDDRAAAKGQLGQAKAAMADAERALALGIAAWGSEYPDIAQVRRVIGLLYVEQFGDVARGERELALALALARAQDADSIEVANSEQALSEAAQHRGDYAAMLDHAERAEQIYARHLGLEHTRRGEALLGVGAARFMLEDYAGSLAAYEAAHPILRTHGPRSTFGFLLSNTGETLLALDRLDRAETDFVQALEILENKLGPQHTDLAFPLKGLGLTHLRAGRPSDALPPLERALALTDSAPGADPQERAEIRWALARALRAVGREPTRARALAEQAVADYRGLGPHWEARVREIERWLAAS